MLNKNEVMNKLKSDVERIFHDYELDEITIPKKMEEILEDYKVVAEWENVSQEEYEVLLKEVMGEMEDEFDYDIEWSNYVTVDEDDEDEDDEYYWDDDDYDGNYDDIDLSELTEEEIIEKLRNEIKAIYEELDFEYDLPIDEMVDTDIKEYGEKVKNKEEFIEFIENFIRIMEEDYFSIAKIIRINKENYEVIWYNDDDEQDDKWDGPEDSLDDWVNDGW